LPYPQEFDLEAYWQEECAQIGNRSGRFQVLVLVEQAILPLIKHRAGSLDPQGSKLQEAGGRMCLALSFESFEAARRELLGWGGAVEVLEPESLRLSLADYARQVLARYGEKWEIE
jgi:predicted DNA-binding transcriptional regulator YafY